MAAGIALSPAGRLRLANDDAPPEFSTLSWLAMLFAAGMGAGLLFWGAAEPVWHAAQPPPGGPEPGSATAARNAMVITNLHWGLHAWGIYGIGGLTLAWFGYREGTGFLPGAPLRAAFGRYRWSGPVATLADITAVLAVVFGVAGSLGMGTLQVVAGLAQVSGLDATSVVVQAIVLAVATVCFLVSASTSVDKGIQFLSNLNMALAVGLLLYVLIAGPTGFLLQITTSSIGDYLGNLVVLSTHLSPIEDGSAWSHAWTLNYLIWWVAWTPFTGVFIARISRGRTIREFLAGVIFIPSLFSLIWFGVFGGTGLYVDRFTDRPYAASVLSDVTSALFVLMEALPGTLVLNLVALFLVAVFLITSADSASFVLGMLTTKGDPDPPTSRKIAWGVVVSVLAAVGLFSGGGIPVLRALAILGAIPFSFVLLMQVTALLSRVKEIR